MSDHNQLIDGIDFTSVEADLLELAAIDSRLQEEVGLSVDNVWEQLCSRYGSTNAVGPFGAYLEQFVKAEQTNPDKAYINPIAYLIS